ncbi:MULTISPECIES: DEAD/DEAH box helicase [unclassified Lactobacillus]|uniref:DEAD/DEAH box helicase n=1 Tax=unclassified Lactobacillus TaxID=2620435 RepID=UPI000EFCDE61|nr:MULTISPECIES: DEAD/DEAH box helicase [unclassified Lactobacillus]RMC38517.1 DEAD/DEAH box helicase [Lactobacillus sp. ESL0237]RMC42863.1 DEAD/DEAH box helicase [Lactobacillus sp. ESL0234]RMC43717.1 DEAD/DEAH box helicase [Lactobacillus sp. ESL0236]RMC44728.1 DEAD/DEAH box helicase [Lactobacillus sp. ESL0230]RMC47968.1 DEAD/DEAH box helicase [Lactobacillus sp. ESL0225]
MKFSELGLNDELLKAIKRSGFEEATPIQEETIPLALAGKDVIGQAQTGTGKTAAFALPILQNLDKDKKVIQALIIEPTRELAIQTQEELFRLGRDERARVQVVYGGADISRQIRSLKNHVPAILVGTPGRLLDHLKRKTINLADVNTIVLDEADEMLDMGFIQDIESILSYVKNRKQTLLFSATMPKPIMNISEKFMDNPEIVRIKTKELTADLIDQYYVRAKDSEKFDIMCRLIDVESPDLAVVFVRTKRRVDEVTRGLQARGYNAAGIHGDLSQARRISVLKRFRASKLDILVATDVAARGLDISGVTHVYNYDIPQDPDSYVHRIGRTGRAGQNGSSITFVTPNELGYMRTIEQLTKKKMTPLAPPSDDEALRGQLKLAKTKVEDLLKEDLTKYAADAAELLENYSAIDLASALLKNLSKDSSNVEVKISSQKPLPYKGGDGRRSGNRSRGRGNYRGGSRGHSNYRGGNRGHGNYRGDRSHKANSSHSFVIKSKKD